MNRIHRIAAATAAALLLLAGPGPAPALAESPAAEAETERAARLDALFAELRAAPSDSAAQEIEDRIWRVWTTAPDERAQFLLDIAFERRRGGDKAGAYYALQELTRDYPDYAEGWNQRATVLFAQGNHEQSLEAIARTLELEPRHFGALAGKAMILLEAGRREEGQRALRDAVRINPWLPERGLLDPKYREERL